MTVDTERLRLLALDARQLGLLCHDIPALENELRCKYRAEAIEGVFAEIVRGQLEATEADAENYPWHSFWLLIRRADGVVVGSADFKDVPDECGESEIGYGLGAKFLHCGYMTEAVRAMCAWAFAQPDVTAVTAETDADGFASQRVLERCGFVKYASADTLWWKLLNA